MLAEGDKVPATLTVLDDEGRKTKVRDLADPYLVLYFYPKDDTPGCTSEAKQFTDAAKKFEKKGGTIAGVSRDSVASHKKFKERYGIPYRLLADTESKICDAFGVIVEKNMYGKKSLGIQRSTFLIDEKGTIVKVWPKVSVEGHAAEVLASLS